MTINPNYYYQVMPFGLKNARVTYEMLVDKVRGVQNLDLSYDHF